MEKVFVLFQFSSGEPAGIASITAIFKPPLKGNLKENIHEVKKWISCKTQLVIR
jgi:hypothetical protein